MTLEFLLTSLIVVASPGTGVVFTLAAGLSRGARAAVIAALACTLGIVPHMAAAITGLAALLHASALAFDIVKYLGVAYLLYMAWQSLRENGALRIDADGAPQSAGQVLIAGILANLLNPKLSIFFFAFLPQFVDAPQPDAWQEMTSLSLIFMGMTFGVFAVYGICAASVRRQILTRPKVLFWLRASFAGAFVALGAKLAVTQR